SGRRELAGKLLGDPATAGGEGGSDAARREGADDREEAIVEVRLAADQHDLARAERGELRDDAERLVRRQLAVARATGARAAVRARVVARERQLPHDVGGKRALANHVEPAAFAAGGHGGGVA